MTAWGGFFYPHAVSVRRKQAAGGMGATYAAPEVLAAEVRDEQSIVRDRDGREVVSSSKVTLPLPVDVPLESLVTVWPGTSREREAMVLAVESNPNEDALDAYLVLSLE